MNIFCFICFIQISTVRKCTDSNTVYEAIRDYETEFHNTEFNNSNSIDIADNEQIIDTVKTGFTENACLSNSRKETLPSVFKTATQIINEKRLQVSDKNKKFQYKELSVNNTAQESTHDNEKSQIKISSGFVCARVIHEGNVIKFSNISSSKSKVRKSKADKNVKRPVKSVYEQILTSAQYSSKKAIDERRDVSSEIELKVDNIVDSIETENKNKNKNKRSHESIESRDDIKSAKKKRIVYNESIDKINDNVSDKNIDKKILDDKTDTKITRESTNTLININAVNDDSSTKNNTERRLEIKANIALKRKEEIAHTSRSKHHKHSNSNRIKVPADKATQFKTAEILKSYLMKYYPSERLPDRATFSKTCREMHYNMLQKKIFGMIA